MLEVVLTKIFREPRPILDEIRSPIEFLGHSGTIMERNHEVSIKEVSVQWGGVASDMTFFWVEHRPIAEAVTNPGVYLEVLRSPVLGVDVSSKVAEVRRESAFR
jgi:hypothetical protein